MRRNPRCSLRSVGPDLTPPQRRNLTRGDGWGFGDFVSRTEFEIAWAGHADEITREWIAEYPGSRPAALYILGVITPWSWQHPMPGLRHQLRAIAGVNVSIDFAGHTHEPEFRHLEQLGLVDADEAKRARKRLGL